MDNKGQTQVFIPSVKLGSQGLQVSKLGYGCAGLSGYYNNPLTHEVGCELIHEIFNKGITFFDTSDFYGQNHDNEIMLGKTLKQLPREKVQVATKFGITISQDKFKVNGTPEYVRKCCEASLKRLNIKYIDLYYQHRVDVFVPIEDTVGELKKLVEEGKVKYIGLSEPNVDTLRRAHNVHPITAVQVECSLWTRDIEEDIVPLCKELGIGIVAYSPLGRGFFGGKAVLESLDSNSVVATFPRFRGENLEKNKRIYARLADIAVKHNCTVPQLALAWLLHQNYNVVPIPGTTKIENLNDNIGSLALKLTEEDLNEISNAVPSEEIAGDKDSDYTRMYSRKFSITPEKL